MIDLSLQLGVWNWLIAGSFLIAMELLLPGVFLLFFGVAAIATGLLVAVLDVDWQYELILFSIFSIASIILARKFYGYNLGETERPLLNQRAAQHIGGTYILEDAIENGRGKIRVGDSVWPVAGPDLPKGQSVKVTGVEGVLLTVEAVSEHL